MSEAISLTRWLCLAVKGSRLSTASASAPIVWVNISRISTRRSLASLIEYSGRAYRAVVHQPTLSYVWVINHASGAKATKLKVTPRSPVRRTSLIGVRARSAAMKEAMNKFSAE